MATNVTTSPDTIARQFAAAVRDEPAVEQLWLVSEPDSMELIAITSDTDAETELRIFGVFGDLIARHPTAGLFPRLLNPRFFVEGIDMASLLPRRSPSNLAARLAVDETTRDHLITAVEYREFALRVHSDDTAQAVDLRWASVVAFYAAVHYVNGYLWERQRVEPGNHNERSMFVATVRELRGANASYHRLRSMGYDARYIPRMRISRNNLNELLADLDAIRAAVLNALQPTDTTS